MTREWHEPCSSLGDREDLMWIPLGIGAGAIVLALAVWKRMTRRGARGIDVGPVSDAWLAEQRARGRESPY